MQNFSVGDWQVSRAMNRIDRPGSSLALEPLAMDVLVHLSYREGLPRALPQAMAAGKPVVAFDCDGAKEVCLTGETGFLVKLRDHDGLVSALETLAGDVDLRQKLGHNGRAFVKERFPVERMVEDTYKIYLRLLRARGFLAQGAGN